MQNYQSLGVTTEVRVSIPPRPAIFAVLKDGTEKGYYVSGSDRAPLVPAEVSDGA